MIAQDVDTAARAILQDPDSVHWTLENMLVWLHQGQLEIAEYAPRAATVTAGLLLTAGQAEQELSDVYGSLLDVTCNLGVDGETPGKAITRVAMDRLTASKPSWRRDRGREIRHYTQDERDDRRFYVWPGPTVATYVEARLVLLPTKPEALIDTLAVGDKWLNSLVDYVLYKAYSQDGEEASNMERSMTHYMAFAQTIGLKLAKRAKAGPGGNAPSNPDYPSTEKNGA